MDYKDKLMTRDEAAEFLGLAAGTLAVWSSKKGNLYNLPFVKIGSNVRYKLSDLEKFIERRTVNNSPNEKTND